MKKTTEKRPAGTNTAAAKRRQLSDSALRCTAMRVSVLLLILSLFVSCGIFTYAKFTNSLFAQRTVAAYDSAGERFSSNYLQAGNGVNVRTISVASNVETPMAIVTVCNYDQGRQRFVNSQDISYTVRLEVVKFDNETGRYVAATGADVGANRIRVTHNRVSVDFYYNSAEDYCFSDTSTFSGTLAADVASSDAYEVVFTPFQKTVFLRMTVTPTDEDLHLSPLSGILKSDIRMAGASSVWYGAFQDSEGTELDPILPSDYDGFNYRVSGVGSGTFTLRWDSSKVEILTPSLLTLLAIPGAVKRGSSITFSVNAENVDLYDLQFYRVNITDEDWDEMAESVVTYTFVAS